MTAEEFRSILMPATHYFSLTSMGRYPHSGLLPHP